jgi:DNA-binding transcriptional regulator YiaG
MMMRSPSLARQPEPARVLTKAVRSAAARLGLRNRELARILGTSEATVSRLGTGRTIDPGSKEGELALLLLRLFRSLDALVGGDEAKARSWLGSENAHLGGVPAERIRRVEGLVDVVQYLDGLRGRL